VDTVHTPTGRLNVLEVEMHQLRLRIDALEVEMRSFKGLITKTTSIYVTLGCFAGVLVVSLVEKLL